MTNTVLTTKGIDVKAAEDSMLFAGTFHWTIPSSTPSRKPAITVRPTDVSFPTTTAENAATTRRVKLSGEPSPTSGAIRTPERPARKGFANQTTRHTRFGFVAMLEVKAGESTTARIARPAEVNRNTTAATSPQRTTSRR